MIKIIKEGRFFFSFVFFFFFYGKESLERFVLIHCLQCENFMGNINPGNDPTLIIDIKPY